jgi:hypothetical protein
MSAKFRERVSNTMRLINKMDEYERNHPDEWCPISDEILKDVYPEECGSQAGRDRKAETMPQEEFEMVFDAVLQRYRMRRKKKITETEAQTAKEEQEVVITQ